MLFHLKNQYFDKKKNLNFYKKINNFDIEKYKDNLSDINNKLKKSTMQLTNKINLITRSNGCYYLGGILKDERDLEIYLKNILNQPRHRLGARR